jgi:hypothetical protein
MWWERVGRSENIAAGERSIFKAQFLSKFCNFLRLPVFRGGE